MKVLDRHIGSAVQVRYDDIDKIDGILIDIWGEKRNKLAKVFFPIDNTIDNYVAFDQIIKIGKKVNISLDF
jgi:hypothetical protein